MGSGAGSETAAAPRWPSDERLDGPPDRAVVVAGLDARGQDVVDDPAGRDGVGDPVLQPIADLDPDLPVFGHNEQDEPVVETFAARLPGLERL